jgi:tRNA A37 threonylcarbamoyladenosine dehydratase
MNDLLTRTEMLLGADAMEKLRRSHVILFGLGGVGSYAAEALCRGGVGALTLVDSDPVSPSNRTRQH